MCKTNAYSKGPTGSAVPGKGHRESNHISSFHKRIIAAGLVALMSFYLGLRHLLRQSSYVIPASEYCPSIDPCYRPDLLAFQVVSGIMLIYAGMNGLHVWHITKTCHQLRTPHDRLLGYLPEADRLNIVTITFQVWDFIISTTIKEHSSPIFLVHHSLAALISIFSLKYQMAPYYAIFFAGCSEISSMFLLWCDLANFFPPTSGSHYDTCIFVFQALFVVTFFYYRILLWFSVGRQFTQDCLHLLQQSKLCTSKTSALKFFLCNVYLLGALQVYWFGLVVQKAVEVFSA